MKLYPSIPYPDESVLDQPCIAFYKYDGSNLRFEWSRKRGWWKFGTRRRLFDKSDKEYGCAIDLFFEKYASNLENVFKKHYKNSDSAIVFAEFFGSQSFAGQHVVDEPKNLMLFDVNLHKKGIIGPREFVDNFGSETEIASIIYQGPFTTEFVNKVWNGELPVVEGVVVKGGNGHKLWFRKVKTQAYLQRLKEVFGQTWEKFW